MPLTDQDKESIELCVIKALEKYGADHLVTKEDYERDKAQIKQGVLVAGILGALSLGKSLLPYLLRLVAL